MWGGGEKEHAHTAEGIERQAGHLSGRADLTPGPLPLHGF